VQHLAFCLERQSKYEEAEKYQAQLLEIQIRLDETDSLKALNYKKDLARILGLQGKHQTALKIMQDVVERLKEYHPEKKISVQGAENHYKAVLKQVLTGEGQSAFDLHKQGMNEEALPLIQEVVRRVKTSCPEDEMLAENSEKLRKLIFENMLLDKRELALDMRERGKGHEELNILQDIVENVKHWDPENTDAIREAEQRYEGRFSKISRNGGVCTVRNVDAEHREPYQDHRSTGATTTSTTPQPVSHPPPDEGIWNTKDKTTKKFSMFSFLTSRHKIERDDSNTQQ
jgi:tetratricopeptide (TPR) repeat protein